MCLENVPEPRSSPENAEAQPETCSASKRRLEHVQALPAPARLAGSHMLSALCALLLLAVTTEDGTLGKNAKTFEIGLNFKVTSLSQANGSQAK